MWKGESCARLKGGWASYKTTRHQNQRLAACSKEKIRRTNKDKIAEPSMMNEWLNTGATIGEFQNRIMR